MEQQLHHALWRNENEQKQQLQKYIRSRHIQTEHSFFDLVHKQCNDIIKGWLHFLASESKRRFLANNILLALCLVMEQIQFSLIKK